MQQGVHVLLSHKMMLMSRDFMERKNKWRSRGQVGGKVRLNKSDVLDMNSRDDYQEKQQDGDKDQQVETEHTVPISDELKRQLGMEDFELEQSMNNETHISPPSDFTLKLCIPDRELQLGQHYEGLNGFRAIKRSMDNSLLEELQDLKAKNPEGAIDGFFFTISKDFLNGLKFIPIIGLDAISIEIVRDKQIEKFKTLFVATICDGDYNPIPMAYMLGNDETIRNWSAFLKLLVVSFRDNIKFDEMFFMSDNHPCIVKSFGLVFGNNDSHLTCYQHLKRDFGKQLGSMDDVVLQHLTQTIDKTKAELFKQKLVQSISNSDDKLIIFEQAQRFARSFKKIDFELFTTDFFEILQKKINNLGNCNYKLLICGLIDLQYVSHKRQVVLGEKYHGQLRGNTTISLDFWLNLSKFFQIETLDKEGVNFNVKFDVDQYSSNGAATFEDKIKELKNKIVKLSELYQKLLGRSIEYSSFRSPYYKSLLETTAQVSKTGPNKYNCSLCCDKNPHYCVHIITVVNHNNKIKIPHEKTIASRPRNIISALLSMIGFEKFVKFYNIHDSSIYNGEIPNLPIRYKINAMLYIIDTIAKQELKGKPRVSKRQGLPAKQERNVRSRI